MVLNALVELLNFLFVHDDLAVQFAISLFKEAIFGLKHPNVLLKLNLAALVVIDHFVLENGNHILCVHLQMRVEEFKLVLK